MLSLEFKIHIFHLVVFLLCFFPAASQGPLSLAAIKKEKLDSICLEIGGGDMKVTFF